MGDKREKLTKKSEVGAAIGTEGGWRSKEGARVMLPAAGVGTGARGPAST